MLLTLSCRQAAAKTAALAFFVAGVGLMTPAARAAGVVPVPVKNMVKNGSFETGTFAGWKQSGNTASTTVKHRDGGFKAYDGSFFALLGPVGSNGFLSQTLVTQPGETYDIHFMLDSNGSRPSDFTMSFGGVSLMSQTDLPRTGGWKSFDFTAMATERATPLTFGFRDDPSFMALDDISVIPMAAPPGAPVPEASTTVSLGLMLALGLGGLVMATRRKANAGR